MSAAERVEAFCAAYRKSGRSAGLLRSIWSHETGEWHVLTMEDLEAVTRKESR